MKPTVLLYNFQDKIRKDQIKRILLVQHLAIKEIPKEEYSNPIGFYAGVKEIAASEDKYEGEELGDEMMVFAGLTGEQIDNVLAAFRKNKLQRVNCKAVLTPINQFWNAIHLFEELKREHEAFQKK
ncbi:MAG: DUF3783 domain-containing protein [Clostridiales bacterium]|nr:DUF3783 domain-containing protein [Clostridiales bacterium]